jgi:hypothetical protein
MHLYFIRLLLSCFYKQTDTDRRVTARIITLESCNLYGSVIVTHPKIVGETSCVSVCYSVVSMKLRDSEKWHGI